MSALPKPTGRGKGTPTSLIVGTRRKIHTTYENGDEMVEEYDLQTDTLLLRKSRSKTSLGVAGNWNYEIGEPERSGGELMIAESSSNPIFARFDTPTHFEWRIRNLPYPRDTYQLSVDITTQEIILRTTNKKYYKRFTIPDLKPHGISLSQDQITYQHAHNTLVIQYPKPQVIRQAEAAAAAERRAMSSHSAKESDQQCKQQ